VGAPEQTPNDELLGRSVRALLDSRRQHGPSDIWGVIDTARVLLGAERAQVHVADYALNCLRVLTTAGPLDEPYALEGTMAGRAFTTGEVVSTDTTWWVPLVDGCERIGVLELEILDADAQQPTMHADLSAVLVLLIISMRRYTDVWLRTRRAITMSAAAEAQWDLLPPLASASPEVVVSGILEPAYEIGGDSFDYAINPGRLDLAIVDAIGHGMSAVLMSTAVINSLRNTRREQGSLIEGYRQADELIARHFGDSNYVTGQLASLDLATGVLTWLNAGHLLPLLVRNGTYAGELQCSPSMPMGLGGPVVQVAQETLQRGDRVLFHTDGVTESVSPDGGRFGLDRLADFLIRATLDGLPGAETVRRLSAAVGAHVGQGLNDDATMLLVEYQGADDDLTDPTGHA
jgi:serine phosphatase RsbU (regulator of sigma subunit)